MNQISVSGVSGGRSSSYMAIHFPTDYNIFSLIRIEDVLCAPKDKGIIKYVEDKIGMDFIATAESDRTLYVLRELEQQLGKEITWVTGKTFEQIIRESNSKGNYLPNRKKRICTQLMKMEPTFWWVYLNLLKSEDDYVDFNIGYRFDEKRRKSTDDFEFIKSCKNYGQKRQNHEVLEWRTSKYPMRSHMVNKVTVHNYFRDKPNFIFPKVSNCVWCFNHKEHELKQQFKEEPKKMDWAKRIEKLTGSRFNMHISMEDIENTVYSQEQITQQDLFALDFTCNCTD